MHPYPTAPWAKASPKPYVAGTPLNVDSPVALSRLLKLTGALLIKIESSLSANGEVAGHADHVSLACRWRFDYPAMVIAPRLGSGR
jgi:hypothetical protein